MATYSYTAFDIDGNKKKGFITAQSEKLARTELKKLNLKTQTIKLSNKDRLTYNKSGFGFHAVIRF